MNNIPRKRVLYFLLLASLFVSACTKVQDEHYNQENFNLPKYALYDYIKSQGDLSIFASLLKASGYDTILNASQTFTVWAPTNDALADVDVNDPALVSMIVKNHIARNRYSTSSLMLKSIQMLSGKHIELNRGPNGLLFGEKAILQADIPTRNGLVHTIGNYVPYLQNIWEYIGTGSSIDSIRSFIFSQTKRVFRPDLSVEIAVNDAGNPVYDSIFVISNVILDRLGELNSEDTVHSVILPNNNAWNQTSSKLERYYNIPEKFGGKARKREMVTWNIVKDLAYSGLLDDPALLDSVVSTTGGVYYNPASLFENASSVKLSNGMVYVANDLAFPDTTAWIKEIKIEAENSVGRKNENSNIFPRSNYDVGISNNKYILIEPTSTSKIALPSVTFSIPNTLSTAYNIYCVFVPSVFSNPNDTLPMKAKFEMTYLQETSGKTGIKTFVPDVSTTDPHSLTKLFVGKFDFEFANIVDEDFSDVVVTLKVTSNVKIEEAKIYNRSMQIDCIILEPILK